MEKQHNRGQEGAGLGVVKLNATPGNEYIFRERALGTNAISEIFANIHSRLEKDDVENLPPKEVKYTVPFIGEIYMGHLRYSTTGKSGISYVHPFLRRNNWRSRNLLMCGNFNMTNVEDIFQDIVKTGQHPRFYSDTIVLLEQIGAELDHQNHIQYRNFRDKLENPALTEAIEENIDIKAILEAASPTWDGGFVICGATGSGDMFALRDAAGIRPAYYYADDEVVVVASERPVLQTVFNIRRYQVSELLPGNAIIVDKRGNLKVEEILKPTVNGRCSFERIYFSRGSDADIYTERKQLGRELVPEIINAIDDDLENTVFSFIPNTAEVAFIGMIEGLEERLNKEKEQLILQASANEPVSRNLLHSILSRKLRIEKVAIKDIKLRTFIAEGSSRNDLAAHVYDVTYGIINNNRDNLVVIDDSIVRGTTLKQSIIGMLDRLHPKRIIIVSSSPQVRYPDWYGIDMSRMSEFIAFRAAVELLKETGRQDILDQVYKECILQLQLPASQQQNVVKKIYEPFTQDEISSKIAAMLTPPGTKAEVKIVYQTLHGLRKAIPDSPGDWYFSGDYPTPGGVRMVNRAYVNFYEGKTDKR